MNIISAQIPIDRWRSAEPHLGTQIVLPASAIIANPTRYARLKGHSITYKK